ncbi:ABC transporter ATP-binding protein [Isoptericola cucumis]|uniref:Protein-tyrosine-phosphatase n=1 Tax=Isoptericola cucumis TaxID=1776856 RepID=A0ABQ2B138_9MICO|nr:ABC transporter ATP-binding protein [Isoptericola cucumis]GGI05351.1 protein-tyrosine-phosphatase [Isoptericola cucumis]
MAEPRASRTSVRAAGRAFSRFWPHLRHHVRPERRLLVLGSLAMLAEVAMRLLEPWPLKYVVDGIVASTGSSVAGPAPANLPVVLLLAAGSLLVIVLLRAGAAYAMTVCFALAGNRVLTGVRADLYDHLQRLSLRFHDGSTTGDLVTRLTGDVGRLKEVSVTAMLPMLGNVVTLAGMIVVVAILDPVLALVMLVVLPVFLLTSTRLSRRIRHVSRDQRKADGQLASLATETLSAVKVVQAYSLEDRMRAGFARSNTSSLREGVRAKRLAAGLERSTDVLVGAATAVVLYVGAQRVLDGALTPGELTVFLTYLKAAFKPMRDLAKYTGRIAQAGASAERVVEVLDQRPEVVDASWARPLHRVRGDVRFEDVWFSYVPGLPVLRGLDLAVRPGERVAIVGASGAGKSSLAALLSRLRDPESGAVRFDGHNLRDLTLDSVRRSVAVVLQESVLFRGTVRENIAAAVPDATDEQVERAARVAGAHAFVTALPDGYDTVVGERGGTLSGGQRQRLAIARAAMLDAPVVVLDEAMTGLDEQTEHEVVDALGRLTRGRTTFVITHDLDAARDCDRVVRLEDGRVAASGPPHVVLGPAGQKEVGSRG